MESSPHDEAMTKIYRDAPAFALEIVNKILEDGDLGEMSIVLRQMVEASGGVEAVAEKAQITPSQLSAMLAPDGELAFKDFSTILNAMELCAVVRPSKQFFVR